MKYLVCPDTEAVTMIFEREEIQNLVEDPNGKFFAVPLDNPEGGAYVTFETLVYNT
jgi:hypothetical protein